VVINNFPLIEKTKQRKKENGNYSIGSYHIGIFLFGQLSFYLFIFFSFL